VNPQSFRCSPAWFELGSRRFPAVVNQRRQTSERVERSRTSAADYRWAQGQVPPVIAEALGLFESYGWDPWEALPGILAISGAALGPAVELELPGVTDPITSTFHAGIWTPHSSQGDRPAMQTLVEGLCPAAKVSALSKAERIQ
jgi:hypothetical protein